MSSVGKTAAAAAFILSLLGYALAQSSSGAVDSAKGAVNRAPSAVNSAPSAVNRAPSAVEASRSAVEQAAKDGDSSRTLNATQSRDMTEADRPGAAR